MKRNSRFSAASSAIVAAALAFLPSTGFGGATTNFALSTPAATNLTSTATPLDSTFTFELGAFIDFTPKSYNVSEWLQNWTPVTDPMGNPLPSSSVPYNDALIEGGGGARWNSFEISVDLEHNDAPFDIGGQVYIWGYNNRTGPGEWILIKEPSWTWRDSGPTSVPGFSFFSVDQATETVVGTVNSSGVEMQTAFADPTAPPPFNYTIWLDQNFTPAQIADDELEDTVWGVLADPDGDEIANIVEFYSGTDPNLSEEAPVFTGELRFGTFFFSFVRLKNHGDAVAEVRWSTDLENWSATGVVETVVEDLGDKERVEAGIPLPVDGRLFAALAVQLQP